MTHVVLKKRVCLLLALVLFLAVVGFSQTEDLKIRVKVRRANVREQPNMEGETIAVVRRGAILQVDGKEGEWYLVRLPLKLEGYALPGYIHESVVEVVGAEIPPSEIKIPKKRSEGKPRKFGAGLIIGGSFPSGDNYNSGVNFNAHVSYSFIEEFTLELSVQDFEMGVEGRLERLSRGDLTIIPIQLSIQKRFPFQPKTFAYITGGIDYYLNDFTLRDTSFSRVETVKNTLGFHVGSGIEYFLRENLALKLEIKVCFQSPSGSWSYIDPVTGPESGQFDNIKLDTVLFGIGVTYHF
jgi:outer membrane protein W